MSFRPPKIIDPKTPKLKMSEENQNIQVFVRCRPLNASEKKSGIELIPERRTIKYLPQNRNYTFDNVFDSKTKQINVYRSVVEPLVDQVIEGYNCTVFAYGQTGTGKTYTMVGHRSEIDLSWDEDPTSGMVPRAIDQLIDSLQNQGAEYTIRVSFLELYNEDAYDLLSPLCDNNKLRIYNDSERKGSVIISGLVELVVQTKKEIFEILERGTLKRQTAPTLMNACSSRSHSIFSITVHIKEFTYEGEEVVKMGKLNLVDLAGSENIGRSGAVEERFREASNINKSLLTLGRVITLLVEKSSHIPYRDSKLTRLLQDSLGGKTKTSIIATISPGSNDLEDTISTLDYAQRAKKITNKPEINLKMSTKTLISEYAIEIDKLRRDLDAARDKKGIYVDAKNYSQMESTLKQQEQDIEVKEMKIGILQNEVEKWNQLFSEASTNLETKNNELEQLNEKLKLLVDDLNQTRSSLELIKTKVEEQKILVESHQLTEKKLHTQAKSIINVTDKCVNDNQALFRKVDTLSSLENKNIGSFNEFMNGFFKRTNEMDDFNSLLFDTFKECIQNVKQLIIDNMASTTQKSDELSSSINQVNETVSSSTTELINLFQQDLTINDSVNSIKNIMNKLKDEISNEISSSNATRLIKQNKSKAMNDSLINENIQHRSELENILMNEIIRLEETSKLSASILKSDKSEFVEKIKEKADQFQKQQKEINRLQRENDNLRNYISDFENKFKDFMTAKETFVKNCLTSITDNSLTTNRLSSDLKEFHLSDNKYLNSLSLKSDDKLAKIVKENAETSSVLSGIDKLAHSACQNNINRLAEYQDNQTKIEADYQVLSQSLFAKLEQTTKLVDTKLTTDVNDELVKSCASKTTFVDNLKAKTSQFVSQSKSLIAAHVENISTNNVSIKEECESKLEEYSAYKSSQNHKFQEYINNCNKFRTQGFRTYETTGETPSKCIYTYPRTLAATSPHDKILARFRAKYANQNHNDINNRSKILEEQSISIFNESELEDQQFGDENDFLALQKTFTITEEKISTNGIIKDKNERKLLKDKN